MLKEIKYRAWDEVNHLMLYENIPIYYDNEQGLLSGQLNDKEDWYELFLMKNLGIKDIDGITIYEGDIIECWDDCGFIDGFNYVNKFIIEYNGNCFSGKYHWENNRFLYNNLWHCSQFIKIIGNIYETPEKALFELKKTK